MALILNQWYDNQPGQARGEELAGWIRQWLAPRLPHAPDLEVHVVADRPDAVFQALSKHVLADRQAGEPVIVDITGAKKSMDAGAFLFAAYADLPISSVDFDDYNETYRRPFGFHCRIGALTNPYDAFRLRERERVQRMVADYHFRAAAETLAEIVSQEHNPAAKRLLAVVRFYEAWDDGDYGRAGRLLGEVQRQLPEFMPPVAVFRLRLHFLSSLKVEMQGETVRQPHFAAAARALVRRLRILSQVHGAGEWPQVEYGPLLDLADSVRLDHHDTAWIAASRHSQRGEMPLEGLVGQAWYSADADLRPLLPILWLGQWVHVGKATVWGMGRYEVEIDEA